MDLKTHTKLLIIIIVAANLFSACSFWRGNSAGQATTNPIGELESTIPFETKEPETYQCEIVVTTFLNGEKSERIVKAARNGIKTRYDYPNGVSFLQVSENEKYIIQNEAEIYVKSSNIGRETSQPRETLKDFLTTNWLNERRDSKYENLGTDGALTKYRVVLDESTSSEILIFVDETLKLPVKQEYFTIDGDQKTLVSSVGLNNFQLTSDQTVFEIPKNFKIVSLNEFQENLRKRRN
jgi:hypothetical protein